jgi:phosphoribulokinase
MPHKLVRMQRADPMPTARPVMLAIAGDSAAGKTTVTRGLVEALGADRCTAVCVDDYHRYDRAERRDLPFTVLHPDCNHVPIMEQHLQLLAMGQPVLKPVYDHRTGHFTRPVLVEPRRFVIVEGAAAAAHQGGPGVLRRDRLPGSPGGHPACLEDPPGHRRTGLHGGAGPG